MNLFITFLVTLGVVYLLQGGTNCIFWCLEQRKHGKNGVIDPKEG